MVHIGRQVLLDPDFLLMLVAAIVQHFCVAQPQPSARNCCLAAELRAAHFLPELAVNILL